MRVVTKDFLNDNEYRKYPIDDSATMEPYTQGEQPAINCVLTDASLAVPQDVAACAYISRISITPALVSITIMGAPSHPFDSSSRPASAPTQFTSEYSTLGAYVIATVETPRLANMAGVTVEVTPNVDGVGGWVVFGSGASKQGVWTFSGPESSMISDHCVTKYSYGGVKSIGKVGFDAFLDGRITVSGESGIEVVSTPEGIDLQFSGTQAQVKDNIRSYVGACGGRPESNTCAYSPIKTINGISQRGLDSKIVIVLDRPLYGILQNPQSEEEVFVVSSDVTLESFCQNRINIPGDCSSGDLTTAILFPPDTGDGAPQPDPGIPLLLEAYGPGGYSSSKFAYFQQNPINQAEAVYLSQGPAVVLGETVTELRVDMRRKEWQAYTPSGVSMRAYGYIGAGLSGKKTVSVNSMDYDIYLGIPNILDELDMLQIDVSVDASDSFEESGTYIKSSRAKYTHVNRPEYSIELRGSRYSWTLLKSNVVVAAGVLTAQGTDNVIQEYKRASGESALRTISVYGSQL